MRDASAPSQRLAEFALVVAAVWGVVLLCLAIQDWVAYGRFIGSLLFR